MCSGYSGHVYSGHSDIVATFHRTKYIYSIIFNNKVFQSMEGKCPGGKCLGGMCPGGKCLGGICPGGKSLGGMCPGGKSLGGMCPGGKSLGGMCPGDKCPGGICPWGKCLEGTCPGGGGGGVSMSSSRVTRQVLSGHCEPLPSPGVTERRGL